MPKATRVSVSIPASRTSLDATEGHPLVWVALFSGIGLLVSLISILNGVQPAWY